MRAVSFGMKLTFGMALRNQNLTSGYMPVIHHFYSWRFVIHGAIDGFFHMVVYMSCSTDNRASTVFQLFQDKGGENTDVA